MRNAYCCICPCNCNQLRPSSGSAEPWLQGRCAPHPAAVPASHSRCGSVGLPGSLGVRLDRLVSLKPGTSRRGARARSPGPSADPHRCRGRTSDPPRVRGRARRPDAPRRVAVLPAFDYSAVRSTVFEVRAREPGAAADARPLDEQLTSLIEGHQHAQLAQVGEGPLSRPSPGSETTHCR